MHRLATTTCSNNLYIQKILNKDDISKPLKTYISKITQQILVFLTSKKYYMYQYQKITYESKLKNNNTFYINIQIHI